MIDSEFPPIKEENHVSKKAERRGDGGPAARRDAGSVRRGPSGRPARRGAALPRHAAVASRAGCGYRQARAAERRLHGAKRPAAGRAECVPADRSVRARANRHPQLPLGLPRQPSDLRPGRRRDARGAGRPAGRVLGRRERAGASGGKVAPRGRAVRLRCGRPDAAAAAAGAAAVHGAEPGAGQPLWRLAAAQYAVSRGHPAENLPHDRKKLGARGQCALCRRLQAGRRRDGARFRLRAGRGHRRRVERGHARQPERCRARLRGRG